MMKEGVVAAIAPLLKFLLDFNIFLFFLLHREKDESMIIASLKVLIRCCDQKSVAKNKFIFCLFI
jgi:hypothetical protein